MFFSADNGVSGSELWSSDGTPAGTLLVKDIQVGPADSSLSQFSAYEGTLYFRADDGTGFGRELWKSDGTSAGTIRVSDINPGAGSSSPFGLLPVNGTFFFSAFEPTKGTELWTLTVDSCPIDTTKILRGICGCGVPDVDQNGNGVIDCLRTAELKSRVSRLKALVGTVKSAKTTRQRKAQRQAASALKAALKEFSDYANANVQQITVLGGTTLNKLASDIRSKVSKVTKLTNLTRNKSAALKALTKLENTLGS